PGRPCRISADSGFLKHTAVAQECVQLGFTATEGLEGLCGGACSAYGENLFKKASPCGFVQCVARAVAGRWRGFFKRRISVSRKYLGPLIAVVTRAITPGEQVGKIMREAMPGRRQQNSN